MAAGGLSIWRATTASCLSRRISRHRRSRASRSTQRCISRWRSPPARPTVSADGWSACVAAASPHPTTAPRATTWRSCSASIPQEASIPWGRMYFGSAIGATSRRAAGSISGSQPPPRPTSSPSSAGSTVPSSGTAITRLWTPSAWCAPRRRTSSDRQQPSLTQRGARGVGWGAEPGRPGDPRGSIPPVVRHPVPDRLARRLDRLAHRSAGRERNFHRERPVQGATPTRFGCAAALNRSERHRRVPEPSLSRRLERAGVRRPGFTDGLRAPRLSALGATIGLKNPAITSFAMFYLALRCGTIGPCPSTSSLPKSPTRSPRARWSNGPRPRSRS